MFVRHQATMTGSGHSATLGSSAGLRELLFLEHLCITSPNAMRFTLLWNKNTSKAKIEKNVHFLLFIHTFIHSFIIQNLLNPDWAMKHTKLVFSSIRSDFFTSMPAKFSFILWGKPCGLCSALKSYPCSLEINEIY